MTTRFHPLDRGYQITSPFGPRDGGFHTGIDFGWPGGSAGRPIYAVQSGTVIYAGAASGYGGPDPAGWLVIDSDDSQGGGVFEYGHLIREVGVGDQVRAGQRIARVNPNSNTNGGVAPHCHISYMPYAYNPGAKKDWRGLLDGALYPGDTPPAPVGIDAAALAQAMGCPLARAEQMLPGYIGAMQAAEITTANRAAMFAAQLGHESAGLVYMAEIADGSQYEWRADLGNTQPGDGRRYKGSGPIQLTGRANFRRFSQWCHSQGMVPSPTYFEDNPQLVRDEPRWGFLAASWYWVVARPGINAMCDASDLEGVTRAINGGLNGLDDRRARWNRCRALGDRLLPGKDILDMNADQLKTLIYECLATYVGPIGSDVKDTREQITGGRDAGQYPGWDQLGGRTVVDAVAVIGEKLGIAGFKAPK
ncbi:hypothetical protein GCM10027289_29870 [Tsukamurella serpentis]